MVLPGYADYVDLLGYLIERCPECRQTGVFAVYRARRKLTITFIPTVAIGERQIMECRTCGARFAVPNAFRADLPDRLLTQEQLSAKIRELRASGMPPGAGAPAVPHSRAANGHRTAYQVLQLDPAADPEVVEAAFKRLALKYHPDRSTAPDAADRMRELLEARDLLTDPARRRAYDASLGVAPRPTPRPGAPAPSPRRHPTADPPPRRADPPPASPPGAPRPAASPPTPRVRAIRPDEV